MKEFAAALQTLKSRCHKIVENQAEMVCIFDENFKIIHVNDAYCRYAKKNYNQTIGALFLESIDKNEQKQIQNKISKITRARPSAEITCKASPDNKHRQWHSWKIIAVFREDGSLVEFQALGCDITKLKLLQDENKRLRLLNTSSSGKPSFIGKADGKKILLKTDEILYIKANLVNIDIVTADKKAKVSMQIKEAEKILGNMNFFRIHRSYIINLDKVKTMESVSESKYKIYFADTDEYIISSKRGAKELRGFLKKSVGLS